MHFANPTMLHLLWLLPLLAGGLHLLYHYRQKVASRFVQAHLLEEKAVKANLMRARLKAALLIAAYLFSVLSLARPQWGYKLENIKRQGLDILVAIDTSKSMLTADVKPSRLERTKLAVKDLIKKLKGDRIGLIAFAGDAFLMCPLTGDYNGFLMALDDLNVNSIPRGGTDIAKAIEEALKGYGDNKQLFKTLILVTDGEEEEGNAIKVAQKAKNLGVKIYTVGVGTKEGDLIQVTNEQGEKEFLKDGQGNVVKSRLNENLLQEIAYITGASYVRSGGAQFGLDYLYEQQLSRLDKRDIEEKQEKKYHERYQWPLTVAFICLFLELLLSLGAFCHCDPPKAQKQLPLFLIVLSLGACSFALPAHASSASQVRRGNAHFKEGKFDEAINSYQKAIKPNKPSGIIDYDLGAAHYKKGDYAKAQEYLQKASASKDAALKAKAQYNLGNALYKDALLKENTKLDEAIASLEKSIASYDEALMQDPKDVDATFNKQEAQKQLERLKKKKEEQQKQEQQKQEQQKKQGQDQQKDQQKDQQQEQQQNKDQQKDQKQDQQDSQQKQDQPKQEQNTHQETRRKPEEASKEEDKQEAQKEQAQYLLEDYERNEQPTQMLQFVTNSAQERPVSKDW